MKTFLMGTCDYFNCKVLSLCLFSLFQMVAFQQDGTALTTPRRLVTLTRTVRSEGGGERAFPEEKIVIADDGVAEYRVFPEDRDELIKIRVSRKSP